MQALDQRVNDLGDAYAFSLPGIVVIAFSKTAVSWLTPQRQDGYMYSERKNGDCLP